MQSDVALRDVMAREFVGVNESDSLLGATQLMDEEGSGTAVVLRGQEPVGLVTGTEVLGFVAGGGNPAEVPVSAVMTAPSETLSPNDSVAAAVAALAERDANDLLVTEAGAVVGTLDARDLVTAAASLTEVDQLAAGPADQRSGGTASKAYSTQSICETCGSLTRELVDVNGQLLCANCRNV